MDFLYYILTGGLLLLASPFLVLRALVSSSFRNEIKGRMEGANSLPELNDTLWIHASSVGEVRLAKILIAGLIKEGESRPIALSTFTPTGYALALEEKLPNVFRLPLDFPLWLNPVFDRLKPAKLVLIEAELWPSLLRQCKSRNVPVIQVNGRVSEKSVQRYGKFPSFLLWMTEPIEKFSMRSELDAERFLQLGVAKEKILVTGNIKFDVTSVEDEEKFQPQWKSDSMILVFGSTRPGEEGPIMEALVKLQKEFPDLIGVIAPRHMERCREVEDLIREFEVEYSLLSKQDDLPNCNILLVDSLGKLNAFYKSATVAYVGGGFNPRFGGHNILEPAALGKPVLFGRFMNNFEEEAKLLKQSQGGLQLQNIEELYDVLKRLLTNPDERQKLSQSAEQTVKSNSGALRKNIELIRST